jgi:hypothetical protein
MRTVPAYQQGASEPVLESAATEVDHGRVSGADLAARPHPGARRVDIEPDKSVARSALSTVRGLTAVRRRLGSPLAAPASVAGLPRRSVQLVRSGSDTGAVVVYGSGLGAILVFESKASADSVPLRGLGLPRVNIDGRSGTELAPRSAPS